MDTYDINDQVILRCEFRDTENSNALTDPTTVQVSITKPDGTNVTANWAGTIVRESLGKFKHTITADQQGIWYVTWTGTGALPGAEPYTFYIR